MKNPIASFMQKKKVKKSRKKLDKIAKKAEKHIKDGKFVVEKKF